MRVAIWRASSPAWAAHTCPTTYSNTPRTCSRPTTGALRSRATRTGWSTSSRRTSRRSPTAPPSTSAPARSSPISSTWRPAGTLTKRLSRTRQLEYGEDVISRIAQARGEARAALAEAARAGVNKTLKALCRRQQISPDHIYDMTIVGNTAMHHLVLGLPAQGLGQAPYAPVVDIPLHPACRRAGHRDQPSRRGALFAADRRVRRQRLPGGGRRHPPGRQAQAINGDRHRHQYRDRPCRRRRGHGHQLRVGSGVRGLPDAQRHEGRRGRHRTRRGRRRRAAGEPGDHRRYAAGGHLRLGRCRSARRTRQGGRCRCRRPHAGARSGASG